MGNRATIVPGEVQVVGGVEMIEVISGLVAAVIQALQMVNRNGGSDLGFTILTMVLTALQAGFFFLVLQVMAESILMGRRLLDRKHQPASVVSTADAP